MPLQLRDYLDLSLEGARQQWAALASRHPRVEGERQPPFLPIETLTCFGLGLIAPPSRNNTINLRRSDPAVQAYARLFKRSEKSLAAKLNNLDGRRSHGARDEQKLWVHLTSNDRSFMHLYAIILESARETGIGEALAPDYLQMGSSQLQIVLDAVDVTETELATGALEELDERARAHLDPLTERAVIGSARVGQQQFARSVLTQAGFACVFCGLSTRKHGLPPARMLIASHIKPWKHASNQERRDPLNGLAACPTHDAAFEQHLIGVEADGTIVRSTAVERAVATDPAWAQAFGPDTLAERLELKPSALPAPRFIEWHWTEATELQIEFPGVSSARRPNSAPSHPATTVSGA